MWHTKIITMETKYGKRIPLTNDIPTLLQWKQNMEREYHGNKTFNKWYSHTIYFNGNNFGMSCVNTTHDIPKLLQWKQNMEREYH